MTSAMAGYGTEYFGNLRLMFFLFLIDLRLFVWSQDPSERKTGLLKTIAEATTVQGTGDRIKYETRVCFQGQII